MFYKNKFFGQKLMQHKKKFAFLPVSIILYRNYGLVVVWSQVLEST